MESENKLWLNSDEETKHGIYNPVNANNTYQQTGDSTDSQTSDNYPLRGLLSDVIDGEDSFSNASDDSAIEVNPFDGLPYSTMYFDLLETRKSLLIWKAKDDFVLAVDESPVVLVTGRAGSGKSTQIPQWCVRFANEVDFQYGSVVCSQPTPLAAMSLSIQVSREMDLTTVGAEVAYKIPQNDCTSEHTILKFCTSDILLREIAVDPLLQSYSFVIVDEVQERTVSTDILLPILKIILANRDDLKVIIISQPHEMTRLEEFFEGVPIVDLYFLEKEIADDNNETKEIDFGSSIKENKVREVVELERRENVAKQRRENLQVTYVESRDCVESVTELVTEIHCNQNIDGDILVFLPSYKEINEAWEKITREVAIRGLRGQAGEIIVIPLHKDLYYGSQQKVYDHVIEEVESSKLIKRRVILSDDLAESSFSINGIKTVIDSGLHYEKEFNSRIRTYTVTLKHIPKSKMDLRTDRCGYGGRVYRLYSEEQLEKMAESSKAEIQRFELSEHILLLKRLLQQLNMTFPQCQLIEGPDPEAYMLALEELDYHGALDDNGNLSDLGAVMSEIPLSVPKAKSIIASCGEDCTQEILTIIAMISSQPIFVNPPECDDEVQRSKFKFRHNSGEHFTLLNIYERYIRYKRSESWCIENYLSYDAMRKAEKLRSELLNVMETLELPISPSVGSPDALEVNVKRALLAGYFMQVAQDTDGCGNYHIIRERHMARLHPNCSLKSDWVLYDEFELSENNSFLFTVSGVTAEWIAETVPQSYLSNLPESECRDYLTALSRKYNKEEINESRESLNFVPPTNNVILKRSHRYESGHGAPSTGQNISRFSPESDFKESSYGRYRRNSDIYPSVDDTDVITQTVRDVAFVYNKASDYVKDDQSQCAIQ